MGLLILIPRPETSWSAADRIAGRAPVPLTDAGRSQVRFWTEQLEHNKLGVVYSSDEQPTKETAQILAHICGSRHKIVAELAEVDAGLWDGLTTEEIKRRYPKVYKRWREDPSSVFPPEGEDVADALDRLSASLTQLTRKLGSREIAIVLGPLAFAIMRCAIESSPVTDLRSLMHDAPLCYRWDDDRRADQPVTPVQVGAVSMERTAETAGEP